jgi:hypothetical protein
LLQLQLQLQCCHVLLSRYLAAGGVDVGSTDIPCCGLQHRAALRYAVQSADRASRAGRGAVCDAPWGMGAGARCEGPAKKNDGDPVYLPNPRPTHPPVDFLGRFFFKLLLSAFWALLGKGSSKTPQKYFYKSPCRKKDHKNRHKIQCQIFFLLFVRFSPMKVLEKKRVKNIKKQSKQTKKLPKPFYHVKKYQKNVFGPGPTTGVPDFFSAGPLLWWWCCVQSPEPGVTSTKKHRI